MAVGVADIITVATSTILTNDPQGDKCDAVKLSKSAFKGAFACSWMFSRTGDGSANFGSLKCALES